MLNFGCAIGYRGIGSFHTHSIPILWCCIVFFGLFDLCIRFTLRRIYWAVIIMNVIMTVHSFLYIVPIYCIVWKTERVPSLTSILQIKRKIVEEWWSLVALTWIRFEFLNRIQCIHHKIPDWVSDWDWGRGKGAQCKTKIERMEIEEKRKIIHHRHSLT